MLHRSPLGLVACPTSICQQGSAVFAGSVLVFELRNRRGNDLLLVGIRTGGSFEASPLGFPAENVNANVKSRFEF